MDPLPLLNFFTKHASEQAKLGSPDFWPVKERVPSRRSPDVTKAFAKLLDTLATICVSKESGQKVAMTVTLPPDGRVIITLSESSRELEDTLKFLPRLWCALNSLPCNSPDRAVFDILRAVLDSTSETDAPTQAQMDHLVAQMHALQDHCEALSHAAATVQQWLDEYARGSDEPAGFPLRRYLTGCLALYFNTLSLIDTAATDMDLRGMFGRPLHIKALQPDVSPLDYPLDKSFWESYLADIVDRCEIIGAKNPKLRRALDEEVTHAIETAKEMTSAPLHCELRLLNHHQQLLASPPEKEVAEESATPPQNYIGTSEPPCYACGIFIDAYRTKSEDVFNPMYTQGPNRRLQVPWAMPKFGNAKVDRSIQRSVFITFCLNYAKFIGYQFGFHRLPENTDTMFKWQW
ncbi:hypothetical protein BD410DRAFT_846399 [Rickenella mellea]|uniref:Uncharacterized protein n=1 Tax=Rickenella mellea TaxID=50990 RepID=A0A4Y7PF86_9AGAM|nr:hypothetical protein BD410DRAFT_846399 [Rickenella mellea]